MRHPQLTIELASCPQQPRRLLALAPTFTPGVGQAWLCHPYAELATDCDLLLPKAATGLAYDLWLESDITGPLLASALRRPLAHCPWPRPTVRGLPLQGRTDPRWAWKLQELAVIHAYSASALVFLLDDSASSSTQAASLPSK